MLSWNLLQPWLSRLNFMNLPSKSLRYCAPHHANILLPSRDMVKTARGREGKWAQQSPLSFGESPPRDHYTSSSGFTTLPSDQHSLTTFFCTIASRSANTAIYFIVTARAKISFCLLILHSARLHFLLSAKRPTRSTKANLISI